jgi:tetratricopeptide (TPR) repeat protein
MATESQLLAPPTNNSPSAALQLSQAAPTFFASQSSFALPWPLSLLSANESQEKWQIYHNVFTACLQTGDNESAYLCLEELTERFGNGNERVMALQGLYEEATAKNDAELQAVLERYEEILKEDPTLFAIQKRRAALLRSMGKTSEAVVALTALLDASPIDAESWAELADVYLTQGMFEQAIFSLEEVLLCTPNAWNIHARLGEVLFLAGNKAEGSEQLKLLSEAMRRFCRSIELCDDYLRGYYGLKLVSLSAACTKPCGSYIPSTNNNTPDNQPPHPPSANLQLENRNIQNLRLRTSAPSIKDSRKAERGRHCQTVRDHPPQQVWRQGLGRIQRGGTHRRARTAQPGRPECGEVRADRQIVMLCNIPIQSLSEELRFLLVTR